MLKDTVPKFIAEMTELAELFGAEQPELDRMADTLDEILRQFYIKTATYSLERWELDFGIKKNPLLTEEQRRGRILAKLNTVAPASVKMLENLVLQTLDANWVKIIENPPDYSFSIYVDKEYLIDLGIADEAVYYARPAHLAYKFIQVLIRNAVFTKYVGAYGLFLPLKESDTDIKGMYQTICIGTSGIKLKIKEGIAE